MVFTKTTFVDGDSSKKVTASWLNTLQDWLLAHKTAHAPGGSDSVFPATGSAGYVHQAADGTLALSNPAGAGDVVGPASATDGHLAVFDGATGKLLKDGGAPGGGGNPVFWTALASTTDFATTPPSTSTITMNTDQTANIKVGRGIRYTSNGTKYRGVVAAITASLLTIAGPPLDTGAGKLTTLEYDATGVMTRTFRIVVPGFWASGASADTAMILNQKNLSLIWDEGPAYVVKYTSWTKVTDSGATKQKVSLLVGGNALSTTSGGLQQAASATWYSTAVDINPSYYAISNGTTFELSNTQGSTKDAHDLIVDFVVVMP